MARKILTIKHFNGGISESEKEGVKGSFYHGRNLLIYGEPTQMTINPAPVKESGSVVVDLIKWAASGSPYHSRTFFLGDAGHFYSRTSAGVWTDLRTVANCGGQGLIVYKDNVYYIQDAQVGRYGTIGGGGGGFTDNYQGGLASTAGIDIAPAIVFGDKLIIGNGPNITTFDDAVWDLDRIVLPGGFYIRSLEIIDEYLAITAWRGNTFETAYEAYIFFWDGTATTYNFFVPTQEGPVHAMLASKNRLFSIVGRNAQLMLNYAPFTRMNRIPKLESSKSATVFPGAITNWHGQILFGVAGLTDSDLVEQGVYQFTSVSDRYPEGLNLGFIPSHGVYADADVKVGMVKAIGDTVFMSWKNAAGAYGVDSFNSASTPFTSATYEGLIVDDGIPANEKLALTLVATHKALAANESIQLGYKKDRTSSYTTGTANSTVGSTSTRLSIDSDKARFKEFQFECILGGVATAPTVTSISFEFDSLEEEKGL